MRGKSRTGALAEVIKGFLKTRAWEKRVFGSRTEHLFDIFNSDDAG